LIVFFEPLLFAVALLGVALRFANFFGVLRFCTGFFAAFFLITSFFDFVDFLLVFFLLAIREV